MRPYRRSRVLAAVLAAGLAGLVTAGCSRGTPRGAGEPQRVSLVARPDLRFSTDTLTVQAGRPVVLTLRNEDTAQLHDFTVTSMPVKDVRTPEAGHGGDDHAGMTGMKEQPALHVAAEPGQTAELQFTPTSPGEYAFWCTVPGHKEAGMHGVLRVN